jgi:hypothetical protein
MSHQVREHLLEEVSNPQEQEMYDGGGPRARASNDEDEDRQKFADGYAINRRGSSVWSAWDGDLRASRRSTESMKVIREPLMDGY